MLIELLYIIIKYRQSMLQGSQKWDGLKNAAQFLYETFRE
jgi:hypothetical protein